MRPAPALLPLLALLALAPAAGGQNAPGTHVGLGVALNPIGLIGFDDDFEDVIVAPIGLGNFTVPIVIGGRFRIEPELGVLRGQSSYTSDSYSSDGEFQLLRYGLAAHFMLAGSGGLRPYIGPRVGFIRSTTKSTSSGNPAYETKRTDTYIGVAVGGEYYFTPRFSLGAEVQVNRLSIGDETFTGQTPSSSSYSSSLLSNNGVIAVRFYF